MTDFPLLAQALPPPLSWIKDDAVPYWRTTGVDHTRGGFHERLDFEGRPILGVAKRLMVQGRQLYVYCPPACAHPASRRLANRCVDYMLTSFYRRDRKTGWVHFLAPDGTIADAAIIAG